MVDVAVHRLGKCRVDLDLGSAVFTDLNFVLKHHLRRHVAARPPPVDRCPATPLAPAGIPVVVVAEPPVSGAVEPVPWHWRKPPAVVLAAQYLVFNRGILHRGTKQVVGLDLGLDFFPEHHGFSRCINCHLKLRLLVFLNAEGVAAMLAGI